LTPVEVLNSKLTLFYKNISIGELLS